MDYPADRTPLAGDAAGDYVLSALNELALDLRWSFNHSTDKLWEQLDPEQWDLTHNPWVILQTVSRERLQRVGADPEFQKLLAQLDRERRDLKHADTWFKTAHAGSMLNAVAYFSMEFMLSEALPIYSGGLGNVAGDQLKTASNFGVPVIGVGLLYQQGYFRQEIDAQGQQQALYPFNDPSQLPTSPLRERGGEWLRFTIDFPGGKLWIRAWEVRVGRAKLYLLDTNDLANTATDRGITSELYGGGPDLRLKQEHVLGIGGWRLLRALGLQPQVCHLNEGHAAFAVLDRARTYMVDNKVPFELALTITRAGNLFTSHTPVAAGFDVFAPALMEKHFKNYAEKELSVSLDDLLALGRRERRDLSEPFNMAYLAIRGSGAINGVSRLHGQVSRRLFQPLFPRWPEIEVPVGYVTNGVHMPTWDSAAADRMWEVACGKSRWQGTTENLEEDFRCVKDADLWRLRNDSRQLLVGYVRKQLARQLASRGPAGGDPAVASNLFDANALTLGFARRFAPYKRPNLLLHNKERLTRILTNTDRPVQLVLAGKAHPQDLYGQALIRDWIEFARRADVRTRVVFLNDYDLLMAERLVQGVDVWVNTPRRPWEASGTSGMKTLVNGGINLSELDGWWAEAYSPDVGWAIGDGKEHGDDPGWDAVEAQTLYDLLEREVIPQFYTRDEQGIPRAWVRRMRESMARLTPMFSTNRVVRQYTEEHYLPALAEYSKRSANHGQLGLDLVHWQQAIAKGWASLRFGSATAQREGDQYIFEVEAFLGDLDSNAVAVELFAESQDAGAPSLHTMNREDRLTGGSNGFKYRLQIAVVRPAADYTPRLIPRHESAFLPLEAPFITWHDSPDWRKAPI
jgi:starch phosphorylase